MDLCVFRSVIILCSFFFTFWYKVLLYRSEQIELCSSLLCCFVVVVFLIPRMINVLIEISSPFQPHLSNGHHVFFFRFNMLIYTNLFSHQTLKKKPHPVCRRLREEAGRGDYWPTLLKHFSQFRVHFSNQRLKTSWYLSVIQLPASSIEQAAWQRAGGGGRLRETRGRGSDSHCWCEELHNNTN